MSFWDVSNVESMYYTFDNASNFNNDISAWDVSKVKSMTGIFKMLHHSIKILAHGT